MNEVLNRNMKELEHEIRNILKKNMWLVLSTVDDKHQPHSAVVVYQSDGRVLYVTTGVNTRKVKDIQKNKKVSITIPIRKNFLHKIVPAPPAELHFNATAELVPREDEHAREVFKKFLKHENEEQLSQDSIWIKITPSNVISTYGVGVKLFAMRNPEKARNIVRLTSNT